MKASTTYTVSATGRSGNTYNVGEWASKETAIAEAAEMLSGSFQSAEVWAHEPDDDEPDLVWSH